MKRVMIMALAASLPLSASANELPLKRVVLSTSGLAQFTHAGDVAAGSTIDLSVRLDQVDDLLKSLTVFDKQGAIGGVSLAGKTPLVELFRDLPFGPDALSSQVSLLNALVGAEVEIEGEVNAKGKIFRTDEEVTQLPNNGGQVTRHRLTLLTDKGFVQAVLENLSSVRFTEPAIRAQIDRALSGVAQNRAKERRTLSIGLQGQGSRQVGFSYVVAAPVWKTSYRLVISKDGTKARLQGWGVIENLTGSDWKDVDLSLVSGNPVALHQSLYSAFYADRPEIPVSSSVRIVPKTDDADDQRGQGYASAGRNDKYSAATNSTPYPTLATTPKKAAPGQQYSENQRQRYNVGGVYGGNNDDLTTQPEEIASSTNPTDADDGATQIIYNFPTKLSLSAGSTMMVPFTDHEIGAARTWLYQPETNARRPLAAIKLHNDSDSALPAGIITAFDAAGNDGATNFVGDAQLPLTPKGGSKFVTFALDTKTDVRRTDRGVKYTRLGKFINGELTLTTKSRWNIDYEITPPAEEDRELVIDEARVDNWKPTNDAKDIEETAGRLRYKVFAPKAKTTKVTLARETTSRQIINLKDLDPQSLLTTISGLENENQVVKDAIAAVGKLVSEINAANTHREQLEAEREKISKDQDRIRKNLASVGAGSDLGRRYLDTLRGQEDRLVAIANEEKAIDTDIAAKRKSAEELAKNLNL